MNLVKRWAALCAAVLFIHGCASEEFSEPESADGEEVTLEDGTYDCEAYNSTRGNGPYSLECEKAGETITIHFSNGGYQELDVDSEEKSGSTWEIEASDASSGDSWTISVDK